MKSDGAAIRYAIYFVAAPESALHRFGSRVLGYDCHTGEVLDADIDSDISAAEWAALTAEPRRYGFHATLKAPFRLRDGASEPDLLQAFRSFAGAVHEVPVITPDVAALGDFVALIPAVRSVGLNALAADCVTEFDRFRAPLTAAERARRLRAPLSPLQKENLERWGYPYVLSEFRFHMTLTGAIEQSRRGRVLTLLRQKFAAAHVGDAVMVDRLALVRQDSPAAAFRVLTHAVVGAPVSENQITIS